MPLSTAAITFDIADMLGNDFDARRTKVWITTNVPGDTIVDTSGDKIRLGSGNVTVNSDGTGTFTVWVPGTGSNPASWQTYVHVDYPDRNEPRGRGLRTFGPFTITTSGNLADLIAEQEIPPDYAAGILGTMTAAQSSAASSATSAAASAAIAAEIAGASTADVLITYLDNDPDSDFRAQQDARHATAYAPIPRPGQNSRNPLTGAYHVEAFGAVGDWNGATGTDNLAPLNAIVAAILARPDKTGRIIFGPGDFWLSNDWLIDGEDVEVICHPNTTIRTTSTTTRGSAVHFVGGGVQSPNNFVLTPQRKRFSWRGGRISSTGSGTLDNALGVVRVASCHVSDVRLNADRKALTPQINVDNITIERVVVERGDYDAICIETGCQNVTVRDVDVIATLGSGVRIFSDSATDPDRKVTNVLLQRINVRSAGAHAVSLSDTDKITLSQVTGSSLQLNGRITGLRIEGDCSFGSINYPADLAALPVTSAKPLLKTVPLLASWVAFGNPFDTPGVRKMSDGLTVVDLAIKDGTMTAGTVVGTIPVGYRPATRSILTAVSGSTGAAAYVYVEPTGSVVLGPGLSTNTLLAITGSFPAA